MVSLRTLNNATKATLLLLSLTGFWTTWGIGKRTGFLALVADRLKANVKLLPAAEKPLRTTFTGIPPVDQLLRRLTVFLWPAIDGTWPGLSLVAFEFSGQFSGAWMVAGLEGLRVGNRGKILSFTTIVGVLSQVVTFATILPLYLFIHLFTSPTNLDPERKSSRDPAVDILVDPSEATAWIIGFTLSYLVPTVLVALPSPTYTSFQTHQTFMAFWELYPIPFKIFQILLLRWFSRTLLFDKGFKSTAERKANALRALRYVYLFSAAVGLITHIVTLTLSFSSIFFPTLFNPDIRAGLSPSAIFLGVSPLSTTPVKDTGEGLWHFLVWNMNVSAVAPIIWAALQYRNAHEGRAKFDGWGLLILKIFAGTMVGGSASSVAALMWARDEMVLGQTERPKLK